MTPNLAALHLSLHALGVQADTDTLEGRVSLQKAIYLAQAAGLPLGYRYSWYIKGPYSPDLTRDYFAMSPASAAGAEGFKLSPKALEAVDRIKPLMEVPNEADDLKRHPDWWLELLASVLYLEKESRLSPDKANEILKRQKPHLLKYAPLAHSKLAEVGLLQ